jgi:hypothetical protein
MTPSWALTHIAPSCPAVMSLRPDAGVPTAKNERWPAGVTSPAAPVPKSASHTLRVPAGPAASATTLLSGSGSVTVRDGLPDRGGKLSRCREYSMPYSLARPAARIKTITRGRRSDRARHAGAGKQYENTARYRAGGAVGLGDVGCCRAGGQGGQQGVAGLADGQLAGGDEGAGQARHAGAEVGGGGLDEPVGVQEQGAGGGQVQAGGPVLAVTKAGAQRQAGRQTGEGGVVAGRGDGWRGVAGAGDVAGAGGRVAGGVDAGGAGFGVGQIGGDLVQAGEDLGGVQAEGGQGAGGGS